jgi:hypothetical protein
MRLGKMIHSLSAAVTMMGILAWSHPVDAQYLKKPIPASRGAQPQAFHAAATAAAGSPWTPLANQPTFLADGAANPVLLTDGSVLVQDAGFPDWWKLTPDKSGSYVNGTWTQVASLPSGYSPLYHSSAVLPDGRLIIEGGEYICDPATGNCDAVWTNLGAIYDPVKDFWSPVAPPAGWTTIGDAAGVVLANGTYMQSNCCTSEAALLDPKTLTWKATGSGKFDPNDEEGWTLLPNGKVLTVDAYVPIPPFPYIPAGTNSELYNPRTGSWSSAGSTGVQLWDSAAGCGGENAATFEVGPAVLRADRTVFYTGSNTCANGVGNTAIYNSTSGRWRAGPVFPEVDGVTDLNIADGPASWEPNDKVLMMASPGFGDPPTVFFEWDGAQLDPVQGPPNAPNDGSYFGNMLVLPTGQILLTDFSNDIEIYTPAITREAAFLQLRIAPVVLHSPQFLQRGGSYQISGLRFNGVTQGAAYGDDAQGATNYPLVRITNLRTSHVSYARTHDHSSMAVASDDVVSTHFDVSSAQERGLCVLQVVANGVASSPVFVLVN